MMKKVPSIGRDSTIAVISPSWGGPASFPWIYNLGIERLKNEFGFKIKEYPTTRKDAKYNHEHPEDRARDLTDAFQDESVDGIICSIGGDDCVRLLKYLEGNNFKPKFFMGYSDSTILLTYFNQKGFCTFHGPSVMAGFAEPAKLADEFCDHIKTFLAEKWETYSYKPFKQWTEEDTRWSDQDSLNKARNYQNNQGWKLLRSMTTEVKGELWGGCLEALEFIKGTKYWPIAETFWDNKILFFEISDEKIGADQIKWMLRNYGVQGVLNKVKAILFGRFAKVTPEEEKNLEKIISDIVYREFNSNVPVVLNMDFGHTYPQQILPLGAEATIKLNNDDILISVESPFIYKK